MNSEKVQQAIVQVLEEISGISTEELQELLDRTPDKWGSLISKGGFFDSFGEHLSDDELLEQFPDIKLQEELSHSIFLKGTQFLGIIRVNKDAEYFEIIKDAEYFEIEEPLCLKAA